MSTLEFIPLGVGDAFSARYYSSCLAVQAEGRWLLVDCPHPIRKMMREAALTAGVSFDVDQISGVLLSHLHADHVSGLESLGFYFRFQLDRRLPVLAHPDVAARLWSGTLAGSMEWAALERDRPPVRRSCDDFFDLTLLDEASPVEFGPFTIECRPTWHTIPTAAFRVRAAGRTLGYSADAAFDPDLIDWLASSDLFAHETGTGTGHAQYERLAALPLGIRERMRLIHYPDDFEPDASAISCLRQGQRYLVYSAPV